MTAAAEAKNRSLYILCAPKYIFLKSSRKDRQCMYLFNIPRVDIAYQCFGIGLMLQPIID